jgi:hypothetical protein
VAISWRDVLVAFKNFLMVTRGPPRSDMSASSEFKWWTRDLWDAFSTAANDSSLSLSLVIPTPFGSTPPEDSICWTLSFPTSCSAGGTIIYEIRTENMVQ